MFRIASSATAMVAGAVSFGLALAYPPVEGFQPEGGPYVPAEGLSENLYFVMLTIGFALMVAGVVLVYLALVRRSDRLE